MLLVGLLLALHAAAATVPGDFALSAEGDAWRITLTRSDTIVDGRRTLRAATAELTGFDPQALKTDGTPLRFQLKRKAGVFDFKGATAGGKATGTFAFLPDAAFTSQLRGLVRNWWDPSTAFEAAVTGFLPRPETALDPLRPPPLPPQHPPANEGERERMFRVLGVNDDYLRLLRQAASQTLSTNDVLQLRSRGINANDLEEFRSRGYRDLSVDDMVRIKNDGFRSGPVR